MNIGGNLLLDPNYRGQYVIKPISHRKLVALKAKTADMALRKVEKDDSDKKCPSRLDGKFISAIKLNLIRFCYGQSASH